ncbi:MAG: hypothetical protein JXA04_02215 [Gammaproteobacteria bacterium]|nr:hypothetical protein [Gammaproteobacteria bacterium]
MLVFILLTMMMGGVVLLSASLFYLNSNHATCTHRSRIQQRTGGVVFDDVELPSIHAEDDKHQAQTREVAQILDFTRTSHKSSKQLPLLGMPDKAFYHIH